MTKFVKVNEILCVADEYTKPENPNAVYFFSTVSKYKAEAKGPVFLNVDTINAVTTGDVLGLGRVTTIDCGYEDVIYVAESLEEVMLQIEGQR